MAFRARRLDHVNVRTANLDAMIDWYGRMLEMRPGPRPGFSFPGAWLYADGRPIVHLVGRDSMAEAGDDLRLEHFAIAATGLVALVGRAEAAGERHTVRKVPDFPVVQVNLWDADGNHIHVDFDAAEAEGTGLV